jgi:hypothetical protein
MNSAKTPVRMGAKSRLLTAAEFQRLADVPPEVEWFKNIRNPHTKRAYRNAIRDFMRLPASRNPRNSGSSRQPT